MLKELLDQDLDMMFSDFSELVTIGDTEMSVLIDNELAEKYKREGYQKIDLLFLVRESEFGTEPASGVTLKLNDTKYKVLSASNTKGLIEIHAERFGR